MNRSSANGATRAPGRGFARRQVLRLLASASVGLSMPALADAVAPPPPLPHAAPAPFELVL